MINNHKPRGIAAQPVGSGAKNSCRQTDIQLKIFQLPCLKTIASCSWLCTAAYRIFMDALGSFEGTSSKSYSCSWLHIEQLLFFSSAFQTLACIHNLIDTILKDVFPVTQATELWVNKLYVHTMLIS